MPNFNREIVGYGKPTYIHLNDGPPRALTAGAPP
jgi:hypothetical protein